MSELVGNPEDRFSHNEAQFYHVTEQVGRSLTRSETPTIGTLANDYLSRIARKSGFGVSDQVRHKPGCAATEDG